MIRCVATRQLCDGTVRRMAKRKVRVGFYGVKLDTTIPQPFEILLKNVAALRPATERMKEVGGVPFFLRDVVSERTGNLEVELFRVRRDNLLKLIDFDKDLVEEVPRLDRKEWGESTAFSYNPELRAVAFLHNHHGATPGQVGSFFERAAAQIPGSISIAPFLDEKAYEAIAAMRFIRSISMSFASPRTDLFTPSEMPIELAAKVGTRLKAGTIRLTLIGEGYDGGLSIGDAKELLNTLQSRSEVQSARVRGGSNIKSAETINLDEHRLGAEVELDMGSGTSVPFANKQAALRDAWDKGERLVRRLIEGK